jgi:hypothetical protein
VTKTKLESTELQQRKKRKNDENEEWKRKTSIVTKIRRTRRRYIQKGKELKIKEETKEREEAK